MGDDPQNIRLKQAADPAAGEKKKEDKKDKKDKEKEDNKDNKESDEAFEKELKALEKPLKHKQIHII